MSVPDIPEITIGSYPSDSKHFRQGDAAFHRFGLVDNEGVLHPELRVTYGLTFAVHENLIGRRHPIFAVGIHADEMKAQKFWAWIDGDQASGYSLVSESHE
jgi:hypothetical protein